MVIHYIETLDFFSQNINSFDKNTLIVFDVGDVLLIPQSRILRHKAKELRERLQHEIFGSLAREKHSELWSRLLLTEKRLLIDLSSPHVIHNLQEQSIKVIALTSLYQGTLGFIPSMEDWRLDMLASIGIDFSQSFPDYSEFKLGDLYRHGYTLPLFKKGAIFCHRYHKGEVLKAFLDKIKLQPSQIIFIDDQLHNIESVGTMAQQVGVQFQGLHYGAAEKLTGDIDEDLARFQFRYLLEYERWIGEEEALCLMKT